ncbi:hypothetical protein INS49_001468 [Diaporthe citri]|uniref:uncharacterized protein n=1 Tax=Diaporthe citri TaxID=83186 RepID=UPI001C8075A3|nr:uncharacterized protein INS49_001468 [Diaporthe citri]KAG6367281.1 hypothetical protein INS49_001468 [Diaporthe citri]
MVGPELREEERDSDELLLGVPLEASSEEVVTGAGEGLLVLGISEAGFWCRSVAMAVTQMIGMVFHHFDNADRLDFRRLRGVEAAYPSFDIPKETLSRKDSASRGRRSPGV